MNKSTRRTIISLHPDDDVHINRVKERLGVTTTADAIRLALRIVANGELSFEVGPPRRLLQRSVRA